MAKRRRGFGWSRKKRCSQKQQNVKKTKACDDFVDSGAIQTTNLNPSVIISDVLKIANSDSITVCDECIEQYLQEWEDSS